MKKKYTKVMFVNADITNMQKKDLYLTQKVVFKHASFFVVAGDLKPDLETETYTDCPLSWVNEIEIIGNIYENPELINGDS